MKLEKVFELGHMIATCTNPVRHVVLQPASPLWAEGFYFLSEEALEAVVTRREASPDDLDGALDEDDKAAFTWAPDVDNCWCTICSTNRRVAKTRTI